MTAWRLLGGLCCKSRMLRVHEFFAKNTKREAIADSYNLNPITEVACAKRLLQHSRGFSAAPHRICCVA
jgi:hypothetical protein